MYEKYLKGQTPDDKDYLNINGSTIIVKKREPFWDYIFRKKLNRQTFMRLNFREKETTYLTWRYGTHGYEGNKDAEMTDNFLISKLTDEDISKMPEASKVFWSIEKENHRTCIAIKREIGLFRGSKVTKLISDTAKNIEAQNDDQEQIEWTE